MDPAIAVILAAIIAGVFNVIVELIKKSPSKKIGARGRNETNTEHKPRKKIFALPKDLLSKVFNFSKSQI